MEEEKEVILVSDQIEVSGRRDIFVNIGSCFLGFRKIRKFSPKSSGWIPHILSPQHYYTLLAFGALDWLTTSKLSIWKILMSFFHTNSQFWNATDSNPMLYLAYYLLHTYVPIFKIIISWYYYFIFEAHYLQQLHFYYHHHSYTIYHCQYRLPIYLLYHDHISPADQLFTPYCRNLRLFLKAFGHCKNHDSTTKT